MRMEVEGQRKGGRGSRMKFDDSITRPGVYDYKCRHFWMNNVDVLRPNSYKSVDNVYMYNVLQVVQ